MIAISYRREDSLPVAGRLYDRLQGEFGKGNVFMDFDSIPYGVDFRDHIKQMIDQSKVLVAMIGPDWVGRRRHRGRRIDDPGDFVRIEIAYALDRKLPIIPVLVGNAQMPSPEQLPKDIEGLAFRNAITLDAGIDFHHHAERLALAINRLLTTAAAAKPPELEKVEPPKTSTPPHIPLAPLESRIEAIQPPSAPITKKPLSPELVRTPPVENKDEAQDRPTKTQPAIVRPARATPRPPIIDWKGKVRVIRTALSRLWETAHGTLLATKSRVGRSFDSIQTSVQRCARILIDQLRRNGKIISLFAVCLLGILIAVGTVYWGLRKGTFQRLLVQTTEFLKPKSVSNGAQSSPQSNGVVPRGSENPLAASPIAPTAPTQIRGALFIDSTPQGEAYEVIDVNNKHHIGKTPETLEDLPDGNAEVIFKREGFSDHGEAVRITANTKPSVTWNFPEDHRLKTSTQLNPSPSPASPQPAIGIAPRISEIKASSELQPQSYHGGWKSYDASLAFDGKNDTAWCSNASGPGDWLMVRFESQANIRGVSVYGGYGIDIDRYKTNNRARTLRVSFSDGTTQDLEFEDRMSIQRFQFPRLVTTEWAKFEIIGVYRGTRYDATPISEIQFDYATDNLAIRPTPSPSSPTPGVTANPAGENERVWQDQISDFVRQFVAVNQLQDANATVAFYAPSVDYFGSRGKDQPFILRDVQKYNVDWPARRDSIEGDIHVEEKIPNQQYRASFKVNLYAENPKTTDWTKGQVATILDVNIIDGVPKIVAINQRKLQKPQHGKGKGPRPPEMEAALRPINPKKTTKVIVKKYGFSALLPTDLFPDAETKLSDGSTDRITSNRGCATVGFSSSREMLRKAYDDYLAQFSAAPNHRKVDYKVIKDNWFVVSGGNQTTGYYTKGVQHGDNVFMMELEYAGRLCNIPNAMLAEISHAFNGDTDAAIASTSPGPSPSSTPAGSGGEKAEPILVSVRIKKYGVSAALPPEVFPDAEKLNRDNETFLRGKSWSGRTTLRFFSTQQPLNEAYAEFVAKHPTNYKVLKPNWFAVSGDLGAVDGAYMGFYVKGVKKGNQAIIMYFEYQDDDFPFSEETFNSIVRSFAQN